MFYHTSQLHFGQARLRHFEDLAIVDFVSSIMFDTLRMGNNRYLVVLFEILCQYFRLFSEICNHSFFQFLLFCCIFVMLSSFEPIFFHHVHRLLYSSLATGFSLKSFQFFEDGLAIFRIEKSADIPSLFVFDVAEVEFREKLHRLFNFGANIVGRFHDLSEGRFNNNLSFGFMPLKNDMTRPECSSHWRYNHHIHLNIFHLLPCLLRLLNTFLGDLDIQIVMTELLLSVLLTISKFLMTILGFQLLRTQVKLRLSMSDEIYHLILLLQQTGRRLKQNVRFCDHKQHRQKHVV